jgi:ectoine hydroxylase-related dioxygenase (phytanoyl-CoA dioxygenase family)
MKDGLTDLEKKIPSNVENEDFQNFEKLVNIETTQADAPLAMEIKKNIPIYSGQLVRDRANSFEGKQELLTEWTSVFESGAGIIAISNAIESTSVIDIATNNFEGIINSEKLNGNVSDHFAKPGANDRVWNSLQKHCMKDPQNFIDYYCSETIALASEAWLGPNYQVTAQVNRVNPGGEAQKAHRDYHLGFMSAEQSANFPLHVHAMSPYLTLQGAIAHCDMSIESGPTLLLPYSQKYKKGYIDFTKEKYQQYFDKNSVQIEMTKGDAVFFNPAVMHGAGNNRTGSVKRMANLLQISSAFGRAMETIDRKIMAKTLYPYLLELVMKNKMPFRLIENVVGASSEGYSFPTNLDLDPPIDGMAPKTQAMIIIESLKAEKEPALVFEELNLLDIRQSS